MQKEQEKPKVKTPKLKEIRLSVNIADHDLNIKVNQADKFLEKKHQVRFTLKLVGRMRDREDLAKDVLEKATNLLTHCGTKTGISSKGSTLSCVCNPKK